MPGLIKLKTAPISIRIKSSQQNSVLKLLEKEGRTFSDWVTRLIDKEIKENKEFLQK